MNNSALPILLKKLAVSSISAKEANDKMDEYIAIQSAESVRMENIVDQFVEMYLKAKKCKIVPFVVPTVFSPKRSNIPVIRVSLI